MEEYGSMVRYWRTLCYTRCTELPQLRSERGSIIHGMNREPGDVLLGIAAQWVCAGSRSQCSHLRQNISNEWVIL